MRDRIGNTAVGVIIIVQLILVFFMQKSTRVTMDGIFSYTLANNPYHYVFIDEIIREFPQDNGWIDAHILKENYVVEEYDRFNYAGVYYHQMHDVHPPLYYCCVHTISSLFPGEYSNFHTLAVNLAALFLLDLIMVRLFARLYGESRYAVAPLLFLCLMEVMMFLYTWARMYMLLILFCAWYLELHEKMLKGFMKRRELVQLVLCILLGTLTHYYFYVYAAFLTALMIFFLVRRKRKEDLMNYLFSGFTGITASWIIYPWVLWHIFANERGDSVSFIAWSSEELKNFLSFLNNRLFNDRAWAAGLLLIVLILGAAILGKKQKEETEKEKRVFRRMAFVSGMLYILAIFGMGKGNMFYPAPSYMAFIVWASMILLDSFRRIKVPWKKQGLAVVVAAVCVVAVYSPSVMRECVENAIKTAGKMYHKIPVENDFDLVPKTHQGYDCIYIETFEDSLMSNCWFAFGEYDKFKKMTLEDFGRNGIGEEELAGRGKTDNHIVVYAPCGLALDNGMYRMLESDGLYNIYEYTGEE